jgi:hypothetical protein
MKHNKAKCSVAKGRVAADSIEPGSNSSAVFLHYSKVVYGTPKLTPHVAFPVIFIICSINFTTPFCHVKKQTQSKKS